MALGSEEVGRVLEGLKQEGVPLDSKWREELGQAYENLGAVQSQAAHIADKGDDLGRKAFEGLSGKLQEAKNALENAGLHDQAARVGELSASLQKGRGLALEDIAQAAAAIREDVKQLAETSRGFEDLSKPGAVVGEATEVSSIGGNGYGGFKDAGLFSTVFNIVDAYREEKGLPSLGEASPLFTKYTFEDIGRLLARSGSEITALAEGGAAQPSVGTSIEAFKGSPGQKIGEVVDVEARRVSDSLVPVADAASAFEAAREAVGQAQDRLALTGPTPESLSTLDSALAQFNKAENTLEKAVDGLAKELGDAGVEKSPAGMSATEATLEDFLSAGGRVGPELVEQARDLNDLSGLVVQELSVTDPIEIRSADMRDVASLVDEAASRAEGLGLDTLAQDYKDLAQAIREDPGSLDLSAAKEFAAGAQSELASLKQGLEEVSAPSRELSSVYDRGSEQGADLARDVGGSDERSTAEGSRSPDLQAEADTRQEPGTSRTAAEMER